MVQINLEENIIGQVNNINRNITEKSGGVFEPHLADAYMDISSKEYIWLDTTFEPLMSIMPNMMSFDTLELTIDEVVDLTKVFAQIIDFRSPFTAKHSSGVAAVAEKLAEMIGFSENECKMMLIAGYLHDLGKLAVGQEILENPGKLNLEEFHIIRSHTFYTYRTLQTIKEFETINLWASLHHERLNGEGYPFHYKAENIPLGSRIMAVADIFTAITEDRPYRRGMSQASAIDVMSGLIESESICPLVFSVVADNYEALNHIRDKAQEAASTEYQKIKQLDYPVIHSKTEP
ncbi:MAG: HD domain-containing protein [Clostridiales bacterium]|nr:HD domain-containing protein [Clostridiales bacterium]